MSPASRRLLQLVVAAATTTTAGLARADGGYVIPGFLATPTWGHVPATGWGLEVSTMYYASSRSELGVGAFGQAQGYFGDTPTHGRYAAGIQAGYIVGAELGVAYRQSAGPYGGTTGVQFGPYVSVGFFNVGARFVVPVANGPGESYGFEGGLVLALKIPVPWGNPPPDLNFGHGRPLIVAGADRIAPITRSAAWC
jgi:hypothetical protein